MKSQPSFRVFPASFFLTLALTGASTTVSFGQAPQAPGVYRSPKELRYHAKTAAKEERAAAKALIKRPDPVADFADLGVRPADGNVDREHSPKEMDPTPGQNMHLPLLQRMNQQRAAILQAIVRIPLIPFKTAAAREKRAVAQAAYEERARAADAFGVLAIHASQHPASARNTSTFINDDFDFYGVATNQFGYCWGVTTMNRRFAHLAFYTAETEKGVRPEDRLPDPAVSRKAWLKEITARLDAVMERAEARMFPGFRDFRELTLVPEVERHLKIRAAKRWKDFAIRPWDRDFFTDTRRMMTVSRSETLFSDIETRIARHELPKIMFTGVDTPLTAGVPNNIHTVLAERAERLADGTKRIYVWDPDFYGEDQVATPKFLELRKDGTVLYEPWFVANRPNWSDRIGQIYFTPETTPRRSRSNGR